jgi:DNA primase
MARYDTLIAAHFQVIQISGDERIARCKWHDDTGTPNLSINAESGLYHCWVCGAKGSLRRQGNTPAANLVGLRNRLHQAPVEATMVYSESWLNQFDNECDYWHGRGFSDKTINLFRLGYDPVTDCPTIPIRSSRGQVLGVVRRQMPPIRPKYLNPKGFKRGRDLFGSWLVRQRHYRRIAIVEGPADAIACWDAGVPAVAMHGCHLTDDQAKLLRGLGASTVVAMTDNDKAGDEAIKQIKEAVPGMNLVVGYYRPHWREKDPGELNPLRRRQMFLDTIPFSKAFG